MVKITPQLTVFARISELKSDCFDKGLITFGELKEDLQDILTGHQVWVKDVEEENPQDFTLDFARRDLLNEVMTTNTLPEFVKSKIDALLVQGADIYCEQDNCHENGDDDCDYCEYVLKEVSYAKQHKLFQ